MARGLLDDFHQLLDTVGGNQLEDETTAVL